MPHAGFVLAGGRSSRMLRDKALLSFAGATLVERAAGIVQSAANSVTVIGDPARYSGFGVAVIPDRVVGCGPAGGIYTALASSAADWNLVLACDMPAVTVQILRTLLDMTIDAPGDCVAPVDVNGNFEPLCAVYHARCLPVFETAIRERRLKMRELIRTLRPVPAAGMDPALFYNINTPSHWQEWIEVPR